MGFWGRNSKDDDFQDDIIHEEQSCLQGHPQAYTRRLPRIYEKILKIIQGVFKILRCPRGSVRNKIA
jgi:hypothetical protein